MNNAFIVIIIFVSITVICHFSSKSKRRQLLQERHNIVIFLNAWKPPHSLVYQEFMYVLNSSRLLTYSKGVSIARDVQTKEMLNEYGFKSIEILPNFNEFNVLEKMMKHCSDDENEDDYVLYIHFKGSYHNTRENRELRRMLIYYVIKNYHKCIKKLFHGADVCGSRYSLLPYRHYSGNMWWSKCSYIKTLKKPKYTIFGKRYTTGLNGYNGDRYSAEKWIMSNSQSIPSDLMSDNIEYSYNYGSEYLYKTWIHKPQNIKFAPNFKTLYSTIKFNKELNYYPHTYYTLYFNLLYDYEVYFNYDKTNLFNLGWCKGLLHPTSINETAYEKDSIDVVKNLVEYCKIVQGLRISNMNSNIQKCKTSDKDIVFLSTTKCSDKNNNANNNEYDVICSESDDINKDYQTIFDICSDKLFTKNIYYSHSYNEILQLRLRCDKSKEFCGKWFIYPFRGNNIGWKASCQFIRNAGKPKYYLYEGDELKENSEYYYGFNKYSYLHWPLTNPFQEENCDELDKSNTNIQMLFSVLLNSVFDIKADLLNKENIHKCYWWCNCFSYSKREKVSEGLNYFCNICNK